MLPKDTKVKMNGFTNLLQNIYLALFVSYMKCSYFCVKSMKCY